ncbi:MAG: class I SAM-dependent methyltransferase [Mesorhizobium sp.]
MARAGEGEIEVRDPSLVSTSWGWRDFSTTLDSPPPEVEDPFPRFLDEEHHKFYGRPWAIGREYFEFLKQKNIKNTDYVLDFGCGGGRLGIFIVPYIKPGRYTGIDRHWEALDAFARYEIPLHGLARQRPRLVLDGSLKISKLGTTFDVILDCYASFHMKDADRLRLYKEFAASLRDTGRIFVPHSPKLSDGELASIGLEVAEVETVPLSFGSYLAEKKRLDTWHILQPISNDTKTVGVSNEAAPATAPAAAAASTPPATTSDPDYSEGDRKIFIDTIKQNIPAIACHTIAGLVLVGAALAFSIALAAYFGIAPSLVTSNAILAGIDQFVWSLAAAALSIIAVAAQATQMTIEARTIVRRERTFAEYIRETPHLQGVQSNVSRASNYYGRLSAASLRACSTAATIIGTAASIYFILPLGYALAAAGIVIVSSFGMYWLMKVASAAMERSSVGLTKNAKAAANWKADANVDADQSVNDYYRHYFMRIFSSSVFSYTSFAFAGIAFLVLMVVSPILNIDINLNYALITFVFLQSFLSNIGRFLSSFVSAAAFIHAVRPYFGFDETDAAYSVEDPDDLL